MNYLLDTNTVIYFFKGLGRVAEHLFLHTPQQIFIPSIVIYEIEVGIAKSTHPIKRQAQFRTLLEAIQIIDFGTNEAKAAAQIRADLERLGTPIGPLDTLIAGCAKAHTMTLVTHNIKEFQRIAGLSVEDWYSAHA